MNKKIKVIELLNRISKGENPTFRKHGGDYKNSVWTFIISYFDKQMTHEEIVDWLNSEVEILEDEEEIDIQSIEETEIKNDGFTEYFEYDNGGFTESGYSKDYSREDVQTRKSINQLIKAVKQLDKKINKED